MADLEEITETPRTDVDSDSSNGERGSTRRNSKKRRQSKKRRSLNGSQSSVQSSPSDQVFKEGRKGDGGVEQNLQPQADSPKHEAMPTQEDHRARFFEEYREVAKDYDKEFLKKHDEDLNTTLIFAGLFSAVTSAFIIQFDSQLQPDPNDETAALLRVLIYKIDNTTFGNDVPPLPQWSGPPRTMVQVQALLFASLTISLLSAFLAMLGKQWLSRYESTDMRGSAVERGHSRQQKLSGIVGWYFNYVMASLPLMLQAALWLLGCALSRYLWEIDVTVASVVIGVTSFGGIFYLLIVIAGTVSERCPYQTPAAHISRHIFRHLRRYLLPTLRSVPTAIVGVVSSSLPRFRESFYYKLSTSWWLDTKERWHSTTIIGPVFAVLFSPFVLILTLPLTLPVDLIFLGLDVVLLLGGFCKAVYRRLSGGLGTAYRWFIGIFLRKTGLGQLTIRLDLECISWILQTSLDKPVQLTALKHLISMPQLARFHPTLVVDCFNIFTRCIDVGNGKVVITQDLKELAMVSADAFSRTLHYLATMDPTSSAFTDLQRRYSKVFPPKVDFTDLTFHPTMTKIHALASRFGNPRDIQWQDYRMPVQEHIPLARRMVQEAREGYEETQQRKVPRRILRSVLYFLSLGSVSPPSVVADCLTVIAIDLGCDVSNAATSDDSTRVAHVSNLITQKLGTMVEANDSDLVFSKRKAINTLFPYAIFLEQSGQQQTMNGILCAARVSDSGRSNPPEQGGRQWMINTILRVARALESMLPRSLERSGGLEEMINTILRLTRDSDSGRSNPPEQGWREWMPDIIPIARALDLILHIPLEQTASGELIATTLRTAMVLDSESSNCGKFIWRHVALYISRLFDKRSPTSLNRIITLISPYVPWDGALNNTIAVSRWAAAVEAIPYTDEVGQNVADALLQIANFESLRPQISIEVWRWLQRQPSLPPVCRGLQVEKRWTTLVHISRLGDINVLKSYLLLVWTESFIHDGLLEVLSLIREDFGGIGKESHREELMERLDRVLGRLDQAEDSLFTRVAKRQYVRLKEVLLELHRQ